MSKPRDGIQRLAVVACTGKCKYTELTPQPRSQAAVPTYADTSTCSYQTNIGYNYFNVAANGGFFLLAARMARYTGNNNTYVEWAQKMWDWMYQKTVIIDSTTDPNAWRVYDGTQDGNGAVGGCTGAEKSESIWDANSAGNALIILVSDLELQLRTHVHRIGISLQSRMFSRFTHHAGR